MISDVTTGMSESVRKGEDKNYEDILLIEGGYKYVHVYWIFHIEGLLGFKFPR